jgi:hypothetical protein
MKLCVSDLWVVLDHLHYVRLWQLHIPSELKNIYEDGSDDVYNLKCAGKTFGKT